MITATAEPPVFNESMAGALIDAARISVAASMSMLPAPRVIVTPGAQEPTVSEEEAMELLTIARAMAQQQTGSPPTSIHVVSGA